MEKNKTLIKKCPITQTIHLICGKWTLPIIYTLMSGEKRFNELEKSIEGINTRMLVKELKQLEGNKLITRTVYAQIPPKVEYKLTEKGKELEVVMNELKKWGKKYML